MYASWYIKTMFSETVDIQTWVVVSYYEKLYWVKLCSLLFEKALAFGSVVCLWLKLTKCNDWWWICLKCWAQVAVHLCLAGRTIFRGPRSLEMAVCLLVVAVLGRIGYWGMPWLYWDALVVLECPGCIEVYWGNPPISAPATVSPDWCRTGCRLYITHTKSQISDLKEIDFG